VVLRGLAAAVSAAAALAAGGAAEARGDIEGTWTNASFTKLERPDNLKSLVVTPAEAAPIDAASAKAWESANSDNVGGRQSEWWDIGASLARVDGQIRSSWIVDPADGKLPYTEEGRRRLKALNDRDDKDFDNPEARPPDERCLVGVRAPMGPPMLNANYNANYQIVQTRDQVAIVAEMNHDVRIIPLNRKMHLPTNVRPWFGDPIGRWEGGTLVVETTNFGPEDGHKRNVGLYLSPDAKVIERLTRISPTQIRYRFEVTDPAIFTRPWRGEMLLQAAKGPLYEYACHEGNYGMANILAGARAKEDGGK
jgi:hypothetical protein